MKSWEELQKYYEKELLSDLKELESIRKKTILHIAGFTLFMLVTGFLVAMLLGGMSFFMGECTFTFCCLPILPMAWIIVYFLGFSRLNSKYRKDYKAQVMPKIVKYLDEGLVYDFNRKISREEFKRSGIFVSRLDAYTGEDYVCGKLGKTQIEFSEIHAQEKHETTDSRGHRRTHYATVFKGIFFIADFNKSFKQQTIVLPDTAEKLFGNMIGGFLQSKNIMRPPLVKMEDPEFEKHFVVYGKDQIEARYLLSTSLMQRITEFKKKTGKNIYLSFVDDKLMVAIPYKKDQFEPKLFSSIVDFSQIQEFYGVLRLVTGIVEDLNLNTRIWSKR
ncbi:MAG: DUF3137 domain-containing protein [Candidatus Altiarchaeota archaeon]|nr:DUF3137 domain-containing protein [Candidatus Altiarchaeota archaeon]